jgi:hypothetical protein
VLTLWEPGRLGGGTATTLLDAARRGMPGIHLDPVGQVVKFGLPDRADLEPYALVADRCGHIAYVGTRLQATRRLAALRVAHCPAWSVRPARPRETFDDVCDVCIVDLAAAATDPVPAT